MAYRQEKVNRLLREEISTILQRELDLEKEALVTVGRAEVSEDFFQVKIFVSVYPESLAVEALKSIQRSIYHFQQILNNKLRMRPVPKIFFVLDRTEERAAHIESLIDEVKK